MKFYIGILLIYWFDNGFFFRFFVSYPISFSYWDSYLFCGQGLVTISIPFQIPLIQATTTYKGFSREASPVDNIWNSSEKNIGKHFQKYLQTTAKPPMLTDLPSNICLPMVTMCSTDVFKKTTIGVILESSWPRCSHFFSSKGITNACLKCNYIDSIANSKTIILLNRKLKFCRIKLVSLEKLQILGYRHFFICGKLYKNISVRD